MKSLQAKIYDEDERFTRFLDPRTNIPRERGYNELRDIIQRKSAEMYKGKEHDLFIQSLKEKFVDAFDDGLFEKDKDIDEILLGLGINPDRLFTIDDDSKDRIREEIYKPIKLMYRTKELGKYLLIKSYLNICFIRISFSALSSLC
jgi:hypothetical protein